MILERLAEMKMRRRGEMEVGILFVAGLIFAYIASYFRAREEMERDGARAMKEI
jgi:hypothetical protein